MPSRTARPHALNCEAVLGDQAALLREVWRRISSNFGGPAPPDPAAMQRAECRPTCRRSSTSCAATRPWWTTWPTRLVDLGDSVPDEIPPASAWRARQPRSTTSACTTTRTTRPTCSCRRGARPPTGRPGQMGRLGQRLRRKDYGRPLFLACSADLAARPTSPALPKATAISPATAGTSAARSSRACCCRRRSPSSPTPASPPAWRRSTSPKTGGGVRRLLRGLLHLWLLLLPQVRADAPVQPVCPGLPSSSRARCCGLPATPGRRRPMTAAPTSASLPRA